MTTAFPVVANNASSTLTVGIDDNDLSITVADGAEFPSTFPYYLTISPEDALAPTEAEIVTVTARAANVLTITRAAQSTTAVAHGADELVELRPTKNLWTEAYDAINAIEGWDTDNLPEGSNLYHTTARVLALLITDNLPDAIRVDTQAYHDGEVDNGNSGTADTIDWTQGNVQKSTLTGDCTFTFTAPSGPAHLTLKLVQDGTGSRLVTWPGTVKWPNGTAPVLTTTASATDLVVFYFDGTDFYGQWAGKFS